MSTLIQGSQLRALFGGDLVTKSNLSTAGDTTANLFTVSGGNVVVTGLVGVVTTACSSTANTVSLGGSPSTGTVEHGGIATAGSITSLEIGTWLYPTFAGGSVNVLQTSGHAGAAGLFHDPFVMVPGYVTWTTSSANSGAISWYLMYVPLDTGAYVS